MIYPMYVLFLEFQANTIDTMSFVRRILVAFTPKNMTQVAITLATAHLLSHHSMRIVPKDPD